MITIAQTAGDFERESLSTPFGFKGRTLTELWQSVAGLVDTQGRKGVGVGTQSPLWCDPAIFARESPASSNGLMFQLTSFALRRCAGQSFAQPGDLVAAIFPEVLAYGRAIAERPNLRETFILNALVPIDHAAWQLHAAAEGRSSLISLLPPSLRGPLNGHHSQLGNVPVVTYGMPPADAVRLVAEGHFVLKIKIGNDPDRDGNQDKMIAWDCARMTELHQALRTQKAPGSTEEHVAYYLDANSRYDSPRRIQQFLEHCDKIGALAHIILLEEPLAEDDESSVSHLPVRVVADESVQSPGDVERRIAAGYGAIALKPAAKTMSLSLRMAETALAAGVPCFCADLTAGPILVDWAKSLAALLPPLPGLRTGILESNGHQFYRRWETLKSYHPNPSAGWLDTRAGQFELDAEFYASSGGIFQPSPHYAALLAL